MQTTFKKSPWGNKYSTAIPLVYRIENGELQVLGLYESREYAEQELAVIKSSPVNLDWKIADIGCVGWGIIGDRVEGQHSPIAKPREVSREEEAAYMESLRRLLHHSCGFGCKVEA
jgi:hypothetical protein